MNLKSLFIVSISLVLISQSALADAAKDARRAANRALRKSQACVVDSSIDTKTAKNKENGELVFLRKCSKRGLSKANLENVKQDVLSSVETLITGGDDGKDGLDGLQGPEGPQGPAGPQGPNGLTNAYWYQAAPAMPPVGAAGVLLVGAGLNCPGPNEIAVGPVAFHGMGAAAVIHSFTPAMGLVNGVNVPVGYAAALGVSGAAPGGLPIGPTGLTIGFWCIPQ